MPRRLDLETRVSREVSPSRCRWRRTMAGQSADTLLPASRQQKWETLRALVRELEEERDLQGLASIAEMALLGLRQLCERPVTCDELDEMLEALRGLKLDPWELGEEQ